MAIRPGMDAKRGCQLRPATHPFLKVLFNILAPGVQEWHYTLGFTKKIGRRSEFSVAAMYSPSKTVTGPNPFEAPGQQTIALKMHQWEVEASYALRL